MSLFNLKLKAEKNVVCCCSEKTKNIKSIQVLGLGCSSCHQQYEYAKEAVKDMGLSVEVEYITDMEKIMEYGVMSLPAVVVNGKVLSAGKILKAKDIQKLLTK